MSSEILEPYAGLYALIRSQPLLIAFLPAAPVSRPLSPPAAIALDDGLPDSLFGASWPAIYKDLNLPISLGSAVTAIIYCGTMVSSIFSARLLKRFGTYRITAFCTALTAAALLGFSVSGGFYIFTVSGRRQIFLTISRSSP